MPVVISARHTHHYLLGSRWLWRVSSCQRVVTVKDCGKPTPICNAVNDDNLPKYRGCRSLGNEPGNRRQFG